MKKISDLSIADLKAAWDFVKMDLEEMKEKAKKENISTDRMGAYKELVELEDHLYHELLNRIRPLER
ncbi:hypothetical protein [Chryseobacterium bernardetii]|uniref:hypothetical protein n=1 Tax=Chryseobacterium bernardetii TaxID=1241978 RepID=UPI00162A7DDA|nr:hypothetical protein [Chryseobacterium bernardetii]